MSNYSVWGCALVIFCSGCSTWFQKENTVLIREHDERHYEVHEGVKETADAYWQYTSLAVNAYNLAWPDYKQKMLSSNAANAKPDVKSEFEKACKAGSDTLIPVADWYAWSNFPSEELSKTAEKASLFFSVWEHRTGYGAASISEVAIVFRGTQADERQDWFSNLRWFIPTKLRGEDQYVVTKDFVAPAFEQEVQRRIRDGRLPASVRLVALGHSLGGGLAQQLAYAIPKTANNPLRISKVVAFNSSPVTGWLGTENPPRDENTKGLEIDRIFEHGEALAYPRLIINLIVPPRKRSSYVRDVRLNLLASANGIKNHGGQFFACRLAEISGATNGVIHTERFLEGSTNP